MNLENGKLKNKYHWAIANICGSPFLFPQLLLSRLQRLTLLCNTFISCEALAELSVQPACGNKELPTKYLLDSPNNNIIL